MNISKNTGYIKGSCNYGNRNNFPDIITNTRSPLTIPTTMKKFTSETRKHSRGDSSKNLTTTENFLHYENFEHYEKDMFST